MRSRISKVYSSMDLRCNTYPPNNIEDPLAYLDAMSTFSLAPGDIVIVFTPDDTHHSIAKAAIEWGMHINSRRDVIKNFL